MSRSSQITGNFKTLPTERAVTVCALLAPQCETARYAAAEDVKDWQTGHRKVEKQTPH
jgi:hypothetical protein